MATLPKEQAELVNVWGPHLNRMEGVRLDTGTEPDKLVATHCCFCGQQCGINLKVKDNAVIGFEPRYDFKFNKGMLCPKGVKRYLQGSHPDRITTALTRDPNVDGPLVTMIDPPRITLRRITLFEVSTKEMSLPTTSLFSK